MPMRMRRLRRTEALRRMVRETRLDPAQFILPLFVRSGTGVRAPIGSMPGVSQTSVDEMLRDAEKAVAAQIGGILLFGIPDTKDATGSSAWDPKGRLLVDLVRTVSARVPASRGGDRRVHVRVHRSWALRLAHVVGRGGQRRHAGAAVA